MGDDDSGKCTDSETDNVERPWKRFLLEVIDDLSTKYDQQVEKYHVPGGVFNETCCRDESPQHFVTLKSCEYLSKNHLLVFLVALLFTGV